MQYAARVGFESDDGDHRLIARKHGRRNSRRKLTGNPALGIVDVEKVFSIHWIDTTSQIDSKLQGSDSLLFGKFIEGLISYQKDIKLGGAMKLGSD